MSVLSLAADNKIVSILVNDSFSQTLRLSIFSEGSCYNYGYLVHCSDGWLSHPIFMTPVIYAVVHGTKMRI